MYLYSLYSVLTTRLRKRLEMSRLSPAIFGYRLAGRSDHDGHVVTYTLAPCIHSFYVL